ncbi:BLUF domain-containing protein [Phenylobacterium sp.]|uniref:BLUF domain-containing protein n=1 Tax=Phenylobacterium sp. TaxID=1871053 RepID=UPI003568B1FC
MTEISGRKTLHRLIYASRQAIDPADIDDEVGKIIRASIRNNREASVTGLLLIHQGYFLQALEGPATAVLTTYGRISNDPRHAEPSVLQTGPVEARSFGDWNMCARRMTPADEAILDTLSQRKSFEPHTLSGASALRLLKAVRGIQDRTQLQALR